MIRQEITVTNHLGIHARPAAFIVQTSLTFESRVWLEKDGTSADAKSIIDVMTLFVPCGSRIAVCASGRDEAKAVEAVVKLFEAKFNEDKQDG
jgi:phosphocarrier protein HPr